MRLKALGLLLAWVLLLGLGGPAAWAEAELPLPAECSGGFAPQAPAAASGASRAAAGDLPAEVSRWLAERHWPAAYALWQRARRCQSGFGALDPDACGQLPAPAEDICQGPQDGLAFLAMHRHLLHSLRAAWPSYLDEWASWRRLPERSDYPADLQNAFTPWPSAVLRAAQLVDSLRSMPRAQMLARWPTEGAFGQWLQCGTTAGGMAADSLYGALLANAGLDLASQRLDSRLLWRHQAWLDRAWDVYRAKLGQTPDDPQLQALLIQQCQLHSAWAQRARPLNLQEPRPHAPVPLFEQGAPSPKGVGAWLSLSGEVTAVSSGPGGKWLVKLDLHLLAAKPLWFTSYPPLVGIQPGDRLRIAGQLQPANKLDPSGQLAAQIQQTHLVLAEAVQHLR